MNKLRWGILSTARINRHLIPAISASRRCELAAVASRDLEKARAYAHKWKIPTAYGSYEEMLQAPDIDVIYNPLPNHLHPEWTILALQAGKHVLCEKPFALSLPEVDRMIAAANQTRCVLMEAFMYRHHPMTLKIREMVASGELGEVRYLHGSFSFMLDRPDNIRWRPEAGGGSLWDVGCYPASYARMIFGTTPVEVYGSQTLSPSGVDLSFTGQMRYANGACAQIESSFELPYSTSIEIRGTRATLLVPTPFNPSQAETQIYLVRGSDRQEITFYFPYLYLGEIENMADAILDHKTPRLPLSETREMIATLLALYRSAAENRPVRLEN